MIISNLNYLENLSEEINNLEGAGLTAGVWVSATKDNGMAMAMSDSQISISNDTNKLIGYANFSANLAETKNPSNPIMVQPIELMKPVISISWYPMSY
ncbi:hypothetical protein ACP6PL_14530 [Dapis sp. BLCC M126]|uniref:hypothetical protein n=1 Tax=Dapis sp. BLCC M126 TaxID=3400189 RepID=UPI003CFA07DD